VAEATSLPIMLYSIPGRSGIEIAVDTVVRLHPVLPKHLRHERSRGHA
jgi:4-hydroxy-tetrahydrodipicolinate synthase